MTEIEWKSSTDPEVMLGWLYARGKASDRQCWLWAIACVRRVAHMLVDERGAHALDVAERIIEGLTSVEEGRVAARAAGAASVECVGPAMARGEVAVRSLAAAYRAASDVADRMQTGLIPRYWTAARAATTASSLDDPRLEKAVQCDLLRDIFGSLPFRVVAMNPAWLTWNDGTLRRLAEAIYEERHLPSGLLDKARLAILADALLDAGCDNEELLTHLRRPDAAHVRGCWAVDFLLEKF